MENNKLNWLIGYNGTRVCIQARGILIINYELLINKNILISLTDFDP